MRLAIYPRQVPDSFPLLYAAEDVNIFDAGPSQQEIESRQQALRYYIEQREETPEHTGTPRHLITAPPGTRRSPQLDISNKALDYVQRLTRKMDGKWSERTFAVLAGLVPGRNPTKGQLKKLTKAFDIVWGGLKEKDMYPILVRNQFILATARPSSNTSSD